VNFTLARRSNVEVCLNWGYQHLTMLWNTFNSLAIRNSQFASKKKRKRLWNHRQQSWYPRARSQKNVERILEFPTIIVLQLGIPDSRRSSRWISDLKIFCISCNRMGTLPWANPSCKSAFDATEWVHSAAHAVNPAFLARMGLIGVWSGGRWRRQE
jgi:hypothetical protein